MATLPDRDRAALLVIDVQSAVMAVSVERQAVIANIARLVADARRQGVAVVWVQHSDDELEYGSGGWAIVPELTPEAGEPIVHKRFRDSFEDTTLEQLLAERGVGRLVVAGAQTDFCVRSTMHSGLVRGYDVTLVSDAHTTEDLSEWGAPPPEQVIAHTNLYWAGQTAPGRRGSTVATADVDFAG